MDFNLNDEQRMLQETVERLVSSEYDIETRHKYAESEEGFSRDVWSQFAEMGLLGVPFAEEYGGFGGGGLELMVIMQAFGRGLVVEPYLSTVVLAGTLISDAGNDAQREKYLTAIAEGQTLASLAHGEPDARYTLSRVSTQAAT